MNKNQHSFDLDVMQKLLSATLFHQFLNESFQTTANKGYKIKTFSPLCLQLTQIFHFVNSFLKSANKRVTPIHIYYYIYFLTSPVTRFWTPFNC